MCANTYSCGSLNLKFACVVPQARFELARALRLRQAGVPVSISHRGVGCGVACRIRTELALRERQLTLPKVQCDKKDFENDASSSRDSHGSLALMPIRTSPVARLECWSGLRKSNSRILLGRQEPKPLGQARKKCWWMMQRFERACR